jgi:hypothetical protein
MITLQGLGYQQITSLGTAQTLTVPLGTTFAIIKCESQAVRWRDDGVAPTATVGYPLEVGSELYYDSASLPRVQIIQQTASAVVNISYYGGTP